MADVIRVQEAELNDHSSTTQWRNAQIAQMNVRAVAVFKSAAEEFLAFMACPTMQNGMAIWQRSVATVATNVLDTNLRATTEFFRLTESAAFAEAQQKFVGAYRDAALERSKSLHHAATHLLNAKPTAPGGQKPAAPEETSLKYVADVMSPGFRVANCEDTVQQVAKIMREENSGTIAVATDDRIVGIVTDHDIAIHMVAEARDPATTKITEVMRPETRYIFEDVRSDHAATDMIEQHVSSLPVVSRKKRVVGMVSLGDLAPQEHSITIDARKMNGRSHKTMPHAQPSAGE